MKTIEQLRKEAAEYGRSTAKAVVDSRTAKDLDHRLVLLSEDGLAERLERAFLAGWQASRDGVK